MEMLPDQRIYLSYTLPIIGVLTLITRPCINRLEIFKIGSISVLAVLYAIPLYIYYVYIKARMYSPESILAVIGNVPIEEYIHVVVQTILTLLWSLIFIQWSIPCLSFNCDKYSYQLIRWLPISLLSTVMVTGYMMVVLTQENFYLGCILCWASPAIMLMWYGTGNFFVKKIIPLLIAIAGPTLYMCWINRMTVKDDKDMGELALKEVFFLITNLMVVLAGSCFDKAYGMIITYSLEFPHQFSVSWRFVRQMLRAFATSEYSMPSEVVEDIKANIKVLNTSNAFGTSNYLFHVGKLIIVKINKDNKCLKSVRINTYYLNDII
uniref:Bifunctional lycopene cyclase/phytoene synthase n=1 Tax=Melanaphis sacchari TaxID=742174 RepID=A0A2H8TRT9_9HEMI